MDPALNDGNPIVVHPDVKGLLYPDQPDIDVPTAHVTLFAPGTRFDPPAQARTA